ncbi:hypothetical protein, partial [Methylobacterium radiotolerans]|uniref:hypothetical protein n=1 Tax=Methylobacterium radiotolerans TaxID=31998 RepID=UPI00237FA843
VAISWAVSCSESRFWRVAADRVMEDMNCLLPGWFHRFAVKALTRAAGLPWVNHRHISAKFCRLKQD